jgi:hypothetical protein
MAEFNSEMFTRMSWFCALVGATSAGGIPASYLVKTNPVSKRTARTATLPMTILVLLLFRLHFLILAFGLSWVFMIISPFSRRAAFTPRTSQFLQPVNPLQELASPMPKKTCGGQPSSRGEPMTTCHTRQIVPSEWKADEAAPQSPRFD